MIAHMGFKRSNRIFTHNIEGEVECVCKKKKSKEEKQVHQIRDKINFFFSTLNQANIDFPRCFPVFTI